MEYKKSPKANLENKKVLFREIGLIAALLLVLGAFEWSTYEKADSGFDQTTAVVIEEETVPITQDTPPPPPEEIKEPVITEELEIVDDDIKVNTDFISSDDSNKPIEVKAYVEANQEDEEEAEDVIIPYVAVEQKPLFNGKDANAFGEWVYSQLKYPEEATENNIQGRVMIQFTIDRDGSVKDVKVLRGVHPSLDKEAVRIISSSPKWTPGKQRNRPAKVRYNFPIQFVLR